MLTVAFWSAHKAHQDHLLIRYEKEGHSKCITYSCVLAAYIVVVQWSLTSHGI